MNRSKRLRVILSAGLLGALLLSGCTGEITEPSSPTTSMTPTAPETSESSSPDSLNVEPSTSTDEPRLEMPKRPIGIDNMDAEAAILTAEYFLDVYNYSMQTGSTDALQDLSTAGCSFCEDTIRETKALLQDDQRVLGGDVSRSEGRINPDHIHDSTIDVFIDVTQTSGSVTDESGTVVSRIEEDKYLSKVRVELIDKAWLVSEVFGERK